MIRRFRRKFEGYLGNWEEMYELWRKMLNALDEQSFLVLVKKYDGRDPSIDYKVQAYADRSGTCLIRLECDESEIIVKEADVDAPPRTYKIRSEKDMEKWMDDWGF